MPPPGHTRGKWLPSLDSADQRFWCGPCNRRLSSLALYDKHCRSNLHRRRTLQEDMLEEDLSMDHPRPEGRRQVKRTRALLDSDLGETRRSKRKRTTQVLYTNLWQESRFILSHRQPVLIQVILEILETLVYRSLSSNQ